MCCLSGFGDPFRELRENQFSVILKGPKIFGMVSEYWLQPDALAPNKRNNLSFES